MHASHRIGIQGTFERLTTYGVGNLQIGGRGSMA
jgi:hypothetical protein